MYVTELTSLERRCDFPMTPEGQAARVRSPRSRTVAGTRPGRRILVVEDDPRVRSLLAWRLEADGFDVAEAPDGRSALDLVPTLRPALVILDLGLPDLSGLDVLTELRSQGDMPILILTGRAGLTDRIVGLDLGADDYVVKPFSPAEVSARVRAVLRRSGLGPGRLEYGELVIDATTREVQVGERVIPLTTTEFDLLWALASQPRRVLTRRQLLDQIWGDRPDGWVAEATVTQHVHRVRQKLEVDPRHPRWLRTVIGLGYRFEP